MLSLLKSATFWWLLTCSMLVLSAARMSARGDKFSSLRIAFWRNGEQKKTLMASRFTMPLAAGWGRDLSLLTDEQATISVRGRTATWSGWRAVVASMMTGVALWPMLRSHSILFVGQRRVPPKLLGLWRRMISFL